MRPQVVSLRPPKSGARRSVWPCLPPPREYVGEAAERLHAELESAIRAA
jgi:hypothetical protein